ncbi:hypothetical protein BDZ89DRAFT_1062306 [Hymenopellis radicata]|nr:hypothetical protein BDZ89DRAFT_1062306 [Hymenopellis radicata]
MFIYEGRVAPVKWEYKDTRRHDRDRWLATKLTPSDAIEDPNSDACASQQHANFKNGRTYENDKEQNTFGGARWVRTWDELAVHCAERKTVIWKKPSTSTLRFILPRTRSC